MIGAVDETTQPSIKLALITLGWNHFFATLKKELIYGLSLSQLTCDEVKKLSFRWIECDYKTVRPYSANEGDLPSLQKRKAYYAVQAAA